MIPCLFVAIFSRFFLVLFCLDLILSCTGGRLLGVAFFSKTRLNIDLSRAIPSPLYLSLSLSLSLTASRVEHPLNRRRAARGAGAKSRTSAVGLSGKPPALTPPEKRKVRRTGPLEVVQRRGGVPLEHAGPRLVVERRCSCCFRAALCFLFRVLCAS